ncbi:MAG: hypothetical protein LBE33_09700 [Zoogloeaceae bacterium]|jgi:hypothetical protein|nr:hypothetical protein [Zoogloeaceae bacterium]
MKKTILEIYALAVCFVTVVCFVACLGVASYSVVQIANPNFTMHSYEYNRYQTNDAFWKDCGRYYCSDEEKKRPRPPEAEVTKQREDAFALALASEQRDGYQTLVKTLIVILIDLVVFAAHWVIARRARVNVSA